MFVSFLGGGGCTLMYIPIINRSPLVGTPSTHVFKNRLWYLGCALGIEAYI